MGGHLREGEYAELISATIIPGTTKGDVRDTKKLLHSVKSGKKWQIFLYCYNTISKSKYLNILQPCLEAFTIDSHKYFEDREKCIAFKERFVKKYGRERAKSLTNNEVISNIGVNAYVQAKEQLALKTKEICLALNNRDFLRNFLAEAIFKNTEVTFLVVKDSTYKKDQLFKVFHRDDVLDILSESLFPHVSKAGRVPEDYNVEGQKTLLRYMAPNEVLKNLVEIEIRNDSEVHYREVRFNMYSKDTLHLLLGSNQNLSVKEYSREVSLYGRAITYF